MPATRALIWFAAACQPRPALPLPPPTGFGWSSKPLVEYDGYTLWSDQIAGGRAGRGRRQAVRTLPLPHRRPCPTGPNGAARRARGLCSCLPSSPAIHPVWAGTLPSLSALPPPPPPPQPHPPTHTHPHHHHHHHTHSHTHAHPAVHLQTSSARWWAPRRRSCWWATRWEATTRWPPLPGPQSWSGGCSALAGAWPVAWVHREASTAPSKRVALVSVACLMLPSPHGVHPGSHSCHAPVTVAAPGTSECQSATTAAAPTLRALQGCRSAECGGAV